MIIFIAKYNKSEIAREKGQDHLFLITSNINNPIIDINIFFHIHLHIIKSFTKTLLINNIAIIAYMVLFDTFN